MNELTKRLLETGYTEQDYPSYVREFSSLYGGFVYSPEHIRSLTYITGCGLEVPGGDVIGTIAFRRVDWSYENNNPLIVCPYGRQGCESNHELLRLPVPSGLCFCVCQEVSADLQTGKTLDSVLTETEAMRKESLKRYKKEHGGRFCLHHMNYRPELNDWELIYKPRKCEHCQEKNCTLFGYPLSAERGNVYYDCKVISEAEAGIFAEEHEITLFKAIPVLRQDVSMTICRKIADLCEEDIIREEFYHPYDMPKAVEIVNFNVRAATGNLRDEAQDREDVRNGIHVVYCSDINHEIQIRENLKKQKALERKQAEEEAFVLLHGFEQLKDYEKRRVRTVLSEERVMELVEERDSRNIIMEEDR